MTHLRYVPATTTGSGWLIARDDLILVTIASLDRVNALWEAVHQGADAGAVLDVLTAGGISSTPPFALVSGLGAPNSVVMARGSVSATVTSPAGQTTFDGSTVSSWIESTVANVEGVSIGTESAADALPLIRGVVSSSSIVWGELSAEAPSSVAALSSSSPPKPVPEPDPEPAPLDAPITPPVVESAPHNTLAPPNTVLHSPSVPAAPKTEGSGYDHLFGETVMRHVEEAAIREASVDEIDGADIVDRTVVVEDIAALRAQRRAERAQRSSAHTPAPQFFVDISTGGRESLDTPIIVGRAPSASRVSGSAVPRLVTVTTPNQDLSRSHAQIAVEGDSVVVTDLHSMNGTTVTIPGKNPIRLREGEPTTVITGTVIDLGDGATLTVGQA